MISIVIVNWNSGSYLERCVRSLQKHAPDCQIVVVDNASTDSSIQFTVGNGIDYTVLRNDSNRGFASACNRGWQAAKGESILFLNPDTECLPGSVECLEQTLTADASIRAVGGCLIAPDGKPQTGFNVRRFPTVGRVAAETFFLDEIRRAFIRKHTSENTSNEAATVVMDVDQPAAACLMTTRTTLELIKGLDESFYPAWFEDVDLCLRIKRSGGRILFQPRARFLHHGGYSLDRMPRQDFLKYFHTNQIRYFRKHRGLLAALQVQKLVILGLIFRITASFAYPLIPHTSRAASAGIFWSALRSIVTCREAWR